MTRRPIVILTALDLEYLAVRERLIDVRLHRHPQGTRFEIGRLANGRCRVVLAHVGKGNQSAAVLAERAIGRFTPAALLFVGVAGALHDHIALGDVVVATHIYAVHGGTSEDDGFKIRPRGWETSHGADQIARHLHRDGSWSRDLPTGHRKPDVHFGPIAAGEVVLNSTSSAHAHWIQNGYNDALAIEMEGAGVAQAGHLNRALPVVVVRGVSDRANGTKQDTDRQDWQQRAVANAAAFATALADILADETQDEGEPPTTQTTRSPDMPETTRNIAKDNARVGVQAGTVHGGIRISGERYSPADLAKTLADLRIKLREAREAGHLDDDTYTAAAAELSLADEALQSSSPPDRGRLVLALKKVRGLISDVADLATVVAAAIALAQALS